MFWFSLAQVFGCVKKSIAEGCVSLLGQIYRCAGNLSPKSQDCAALNRGWPFNWCRLAGWPGVAVAGAVAVKVGHGVRVGDGVPPPPVPHCWATNSNNPATVVAVYSTPRCMNLITRPRPPLSQLAARLKFANIRAWPAVLPMPSSISTTFSSPTTSSIVS